MDALGMVEVNSIAAGMEVSDAMLKAANVRLVGAQPVCAGKYITLVQGDVAAVKSSVDAGVSVAGNYHVDSFIIPNLHEQIFKALACATALERTDAIGTIETYSLATCIEAADTAVKSANIELIEIRLGRGLGGKSFVTMTGDVSAVKFAVENAVKSLGSGGMLLKTSVIPSPHPDLIKSIV